MNFFLVTRRVGRGGTGSLGLNTVKKRKKIDYFQIELHSEEMGLRLQHSDFGGSEPQRSDGLPPHSPAFTDHSRYIYSHRIQA